MSGAQDSHLKQACARAQPKSFALLAQCGCSGSFNVNMFDTASNSWHMFEISSKYDPKFGEIKVEVLSASDGGLVCFLSKALSKSKKTPWLVSVCNPLTRVWKQLPPLYGIVQQCIMVQLIMDQERKHYRVFVVGHSKDPEVGNLVNVYHSETGQWTKADGSSSGEVVYSYPYKSKSYSFKPAPYSYNFADGLVHEIVFNIPGNSGLDEVLVKDHLFCVKDKEPGAALHCIAEYQAVNCGTSWTPLKEYPLNRLPSNLHIPPEHLLCFTSISVCKDFLLLCAISEECEFLFIYEFSREEWREIPMMHGDDDLFVDQMHMCELRFNSVP